MKRIKPQVWLILVVLMLSSAIAVRGVMALGPANSLGAAGAAGATGPTGPTGPGFSNVTEQVFTASSCSGGSSPCTYTATSGTKFVIVECVGGGGAGGGALGVTSVINSGGGGGSGSYSRVRLTGAAATGQTVTIGAGGTAGTAGNNPGNNGGDTSLGTLCVGKGGTGGNSNTSLNQAAGGLGGVLGTGDFRSVGNDGQQSVTMNAITLTPPFPMGGAGPWGGQANQNRITGAGCFTGGTAGGFGTGGGGGLCYNTASNGAGAIGAPGVVIITEYQ